MPRAISPPKEEVPANEVPPLQSLRLTGSPPDHALQALCRASEVQVRLKIGQGYPFRLAQINPAGGAWSPDAGLARAVDDDNRQVGFDADLAGQPGIRFEVRFTGQLCLGRCSLASASPASIWTRQVVQRCVALRNGAHSPPRRPRSPGPASSLFSTSNDFSTSIATVGIRH